MFGLGRGLLLHTFPICDTGDEKDRRSLQSKISGKSHRESREVLNPALARACCLSEFCAVFPSVFVTESR